MLIESSTALAAHTVAVDENLNGDASRPSTSLSRTMRGLVEKGRGPRTGSALFIRGRQLACVPHQSVHLGIDMSPCRLYLTEKKRRKNLGRPDINSLLLWTSVRANDF